MKRPTTKRGWLIALLPLYVLILACGGAAQSTTPTEPPTPVAMPLPTEPPESTVLPEPTVEPPVEPTTALMSTGAPAAATDPAGVAPLNQDDCPPEYSVKGNIRDDGTQIYHERGFRSYANTDPEVCFASAVDAAAAGFERAANQ